MPSTTSWQQAYQELEQQFITTFLIKMEPNILPQLFGTDDLDLPNYSSNSDSSLSSDNTYWRSSDDSMMNEDIFDTSSSSSSDSDIVATDCIKEAAITFLNGVETVGALTK